MKRLINTKVCVMVVLMGLCGGGVRAELPEGFGLAGKYVGDKGIGKDAAVVFADDFEDGGLADVIKNWSEASNKNGKVLSLDEAHSPFPGLSKRSLKITANRGKDTGGHLYKKLPRELDTAFARFYVRFPAEGQYIHHFTHFGAYRPATNWPQGGAGVRPIGDKRMTVGIEPFGSSGRLPAPGNWNFYAYWHKMKASARNQYWGNGLQPIVPQKAKAGEWQCVEIMIKMNTPNKPDGELGLWLDGKLVAHMKKGIRTTRWTGMGFKQLAEGGEVFEGFDFRTSDKLKVNFFWLLHYVTDTNDRRNSGGKKLAATNPVWFDHVVVAREYIGPVRVK